jgi:hypothetical protein
MSSDIGRLSLKSIDGGNQLIIDDRYADDDARHVVACITPADEGVGVVWLQPPSMARRYPTAEAALTAAVSADRHQDRASRPIPIAHFRPASGAAH